MTNQITKDQSLNMIEKDIAAEIAGHEFWGDLDLSYYEFEALRDRVKTILAVDGVDIVYICKEYPHAITSLLVFFSRYKYNTNFWGSLEEKLEISLPQIHQAHLGTCARTMFDKYRFDYSDSKEESRKHIAPIIYEACLPPESSLDDLFYVLSYDSYGMFDPQLVIDELIEMRSYSIRKPLLRFLKRFKDERAIEFLLEIRDAITCAEQKTMHTSRYSNIYSEWKENEKSKTAIANRKKQEFQTKPYLYFDNGKKGLCIILPRVVMENEWIDEVAWTVRGKGDFTKTIYATVMGDEGTRYLDTMVVPIAPDEKYFISLEDSENLDDSNAKLWEIDGVPNDKVLMFNQTGRQVNPNYLLSPFGVMVIPDSLSIEESKHIELVDQYYPTNTSEYRIVVATLLSSDAYICYVGNAARIKISARPQINMRLEGKSLFSLNATNCGMSIFTELPTLTIDVEGDISTKGLELRVAGADMFIELDDNGTSKYSYHIRDILGNSSVAYGMYSVRLYQFGRFLRQLEFCFVPEVQTTYSSRITWPQIDGRKGKKHYRFEKILDWEFEFSNSLVGEDDTGYSIQCASNIGAIQMQIKSISDDFNFQCTIDLPVNPFELEFVNSEGMALENLTDKMNKIGIQDLLDGNYWILMKTYGLYVNKQYQIALVSVNGTEQVENIQLTVNGAGNINLMPFNDTLRNCPLPARIELHSFEADEEPIPMLLITEKLTMESKPKYQLGTSKDFIILGLEDDGKDIDITRFGYPVKEHHLPYEKSLLGRSGRSRAYIYPEKLTEGIYIVSGSKEESMFEFENENAIELSACNNVFLVSYWDKDNPRLTNIKLWLNLFIHDVIYTENNADIELCKSVQIMNSENVMSQLEKGELDEYDLEKVVALAYFANSKISHNKKNAIIRGMNYISMNLLRRGDRYKIIKLLLNLKCPQEVFNICLKEYALMLFYTDSDDMKQIVSDVEEYSTELAMLLAMNCNGSIRECVLRDKFRDLIGKDAIRKFIVVPGESDPVAIAGEQKKFLREENESKIRINLDDEISGNQQVIQGMIGYDKRNYPIFDISKKPDYGVYFARIKYVDQYVNWYKNTHDNKQDMNPTLKKLKDSVVKKYYTDIIHAIFLLEKDDRLGNITTQYKKVLSQRCTGQISENKPNNVSYALYFMTQGFAAYLAKLPSDREDLDDVRHLGITFMSYATTIAPRMSQRDILMVATYSYLKRKEEELCR